MPTGDARAAAGFTLIELLVVLGILGLLFSVVLPMLDGARGRAELRATARDIAAGLRETRSHAIAAGQSDAFIVDTANNTFRTGADGHLQPLPPGIRPRLFTPADEALGDKIADIRFFPDGSSTGGGIRLARQGSVYDVAVDWLTGRVSVRTGIAGAKDGSAKDGGLLAH